MKAAITILDHLQFDCPTAQQKSALFAMSEFVLETNAEDYLILSGAAGTGKTSITTALIGYLNSRAVQYKIAAPTGRAARILGRKSKEISSTVHSMIYNSKPNPDTGVVVFERKENVVSDFTIYIIDEASMISSVVSADGNMFQAANSLLADLIAFVKCGNKNNKLIFLGDKNQLPPVHEKDSKALCPVYLETKFHLTGSAHFLTEVKRQEDGSYILKNACAIREGIDQGKQSVPFHDVEKHSVGVAAANYVNGYKQQGNEGAVSIGASHNMNKMFNGVIRDKLYGMGAKVLEQDDLLLITTQWRRNEYILYSGDHVIVKEINLNQIEQVAGLHFVPVKIESKTIDDTVERIEDYILIESVLNPEGLTMQQESRLRHERFTKNKVYRGSGNASDDRYVGAIRATYGHSITCHKAQGGEWDTVFLNSYSIPGLKFQYTAVTRAISTLILY